MIAFDSGWIKDQFIEGETDIVSKLTDLKTLKT